MNTTTAFTAKSLACAIVLGLSVSTSGAMNLSELAPCKPAAARYCDRTGGMTTANLLKCGQVLAAQSEKVGPQCRDVLKRYGQL